MSKFVGKTLSIIFLFTALFAHCLHAAEPIVPAQHPEVVLQTELSNDKELKNLLAIFNKQTEIATKSLLNADFVPGIVTVLDGDDLLARGIQSISEALTLVPGFNISSGRVENPEINIRGLNEGLFSGNVKIMLDGLSLNTPRTGTGIAFLAMPVSNIERIEVIRGPGSAVYGEHAYAGIINLVTRKNDNQAFVRYGRYDSVVGGGVFSWEHPEWDFHISGNLAGSKTKGADINTGTDILHQNFFGLANISNAPGITNESEENYSGGVTLKFKDFSLTTQYFERATNDGFGAAEALPPRQDGERARQQIWVSEAHQQLFISNELKADIKLGWREHDITVKNEFIFPPGFFGFPNGQIFGLSYDESEIRGGLDLTWTGLENHTLLLGWGVSRTIIDDAFLETNFVPSTGAALATVQRFRGSENFLDTSFDRMWNSVFIQDEYRITSEFTLTSGLRYDVYDRIDNNLSARLAGVWRITDHHILKAQYGRAYRPPSFQELLANSAPTFVGNRSLDSATIDTYELAYIYKAERTTAKATLFFSDLHDVISLQTQGTNTPRFENTEGAHIFGVEVELEKKLTNTLKLDANLSYSDNTDTETNKQIANSVNWLANIGLLYQPINDVTLNAQYRYVGDRNREPSDNRGQLRGYQTVNITGNLFNIGIQGLTLRAGVKNILDEHVIEPAPANTYPEDYSRPGREWWVELSTKFN